MLSRIEYVFNNGIGPRTLLKSWRIYRKTQAYRDGRSVRYFLINGNTIVNLDKNARIINKGTFRCGLKNSGSMISSAPCIIDMGENSKIVINGSIETGSGVLISVNKQATLELGDNITINSNTKIICSSSIKIGNGSIISWDVEIRDTDFHTVLQDNYHICKPIEIGEHVWIGSRATICKGVKIGSGSVIACGSIVTKNVPNKCIAAGVPATIVREKIDWKI